MRARASADAPAVDVALKEWSLICDALMTGEHIAIARKGGVRDAKGAFRLERRHFALFPTNFHADVAGAPEGTRTGDMKAGESVSMRLTATATRAWRVPASSAEACFALFSESSGWPKDLFAKRANFKPSNEVTVVELRAYEVADALTLPPDEQRYGGCKSWINIDSWRPANVRAVLSDEEFAEKSSALGRDLAVLGATEIDVTNA